MLSYTHSSLWVRLCEQPQPPLNSSECRRECSESFERGCYYTEATAIYIISLCRYGKRNAKKGSREISTMFLMFVECAKAIKQKPILHSSRSAHKHVPAAVSLAVHTPERARLSKCALVLFRFLFYFLGYIERKQNTYIHLCKLYRKECGYKQTLFYLYILFCQQLCSVVLLGCSCLHFSCSHKNKLFSLCGIYIQ